MTNDDWTGHSRPGSAQAPRRRAASSAFPTSAHAAPTADSQRMDVDDELVPGDVPHNPAHGAQCRCAQCHLRTARFPRRHDGRIVLPDPALLALSGLEGPGRARVARRRVSVAGVIEDIDRGEGSSTGRTAGSGGILAPRTRLRRPEDPYTHGADDVEVHASGAYNRPPAGETQGRFGHRRPSLNDRTRPHRTSKPYDAKLSATSDCDGSPLLGFKDPAIRPGPWSRARSVRRHATSPIVGVGQQDFRAHDDPSSHSAMSPEGAGRPPLQTSSRLPTITDSSISLGALYNATTLSHPLLPRNLYSDARQSPSYYPNQAKSTSSNLLTRPSSSTHSLQSRYQSLPPTSRDLSYANTNPISNAEGPPYVLREINFIPRKNAQQHPTIYSQTNPSPPIADLALTPNTNSISNPTITAFASASGAPAALGYAQQSSSSSRYTGSSYGARSTQGHSVTAARPLAAVSEERAHSGGAGGSHAHGERDRYAERDSARGTRRTPSTEREESVSSPPRGDEEDQGPSFRASGLPGVLPPASSYYRRRSNAQSKSSPAESQEEGGATTPGEAGAPAPAPAPSASTSAGVRFLGPETPQSLLAKVTAASAQRAKQQQQQQREREGQGGSGSAASGVSVKWEHDRKRRQGYFAADDEGEEKSPFRHYNKTNYD